MIKVRNELGESPCYLCDFACSTKQKLAYHTFTVHNTPQSLICSYCQFKFKDVSSVRRHIRTVHINAKDYMCTYCNKKYKHKYDLEKHFSKIHKTRPMEGQNFCSECKLLCFGWEQLKKHYLDAHGKTIQHIKCPQCYKIFFDVMYLKQHFKRVHNNKTMSVVYCQHCGAVFEEDTALVRHMEEKHFWNGESAVFCREDQCDELFEDMSELETHIQAVHKGSKRVRVSPTSYCSGTESDCPVCSDTQPSKLQLVAHLTESHHWRSVMECQKCYKLFPTCAEVQEHLNSHCLEPEDAPLLPSGKHSILKKRLLKRKNIKDLSRDLEPRFFVGFVRLDDQKEPALQEEVEVETNNGEGSSYHDDAEQPSYHDDAEQSSYQDDAEQSSYHENSSAHFHEDEQYHDNPDSDGCHDNTDSCHGNAGACHNGECGDCTQHEVGTKRRFSVRQKEEEREEEEGVKVKRKVKATTTERKRVLRKLPST
ncbi:zinc finger and BTB domain-containing protein 40-like [Bolinopsis microptera]|uniref:zinc finger and BTB domain-containing protein 40-like n=1 Tax=Bolinopsis microptera TaxID=2820187 RepID=UPI00307AD505